MIIYIIGTSKQGKKYSQCRLVSGKNNLTIGAGNSFKHPTNLVLINNLHKDNINKFHTVPQGSLVWVPDKTFVPILRKKNPRVKLNVIRPGKVTKYKKFYIAPFKIPTSKSDETYAFNIEAEKKRIVWISNYKNLIGTSKYLKNLDSIFISSITNKTMQWFEAQNVKPKKILINNNKKELTDKIKKSFPNFKINKTYDGQIIRI